MKFVDYVLFKNPVGSNVRVRNFVVKYRLDENSNLNDRFGIGKKSRAIINKLQIKYKRRIEK